MKKIKLFILYSWSALMLISGMNFWVSTMGVVYGGEFGMLITAVGGLGMVMVWLALFGVWFTLPEKQSA